MTNILSDGNVPTLTPPRTITKTQLDEAIDILKLAIAEVTQSSYATIQ